MVLLEEPLIQVRKGSQGKRGWFVNFAGHVQANQSHSAHVLLRNGTAVNASYQIGGCNHHGFMAQPAQLLNVSESRHQVVDGSGVNIYRRRGVGIIDCFLLEHSVQCFDKSSPHVSSLSKALRRLLCCWAEPRPVFLCHTSLLVKKVNQSICGYVVMNC